MKFLIMATPLPIPIPPELGADLYRAAGDWLGQRLGDGRMDCVYTFVDAGGLAISNAESHEQVFAELLSYPLYRFFGWEVKPLCEWEPTFDTVIEAFSRGSG
jgi:hypothetical protein